jgi:hypothetical protein
MKNILLVLLMAFSFIGCSSKSDVNKNVEAKLVVGKSLSDIKLSDQNEKLHTLNADTKIVFFSFSKPMGHACNDFLEKKSANFLAEHHALYVADISAAPGLIKKMFILPDLKELKFPILLINDDTLSAEYSKGMNKAKIVVVFLDNGTITKIKNLDDTKALETLFSK